MRDLTVDKLAPVVNNAFDETLQNERQVVSKVEQD